MCKLSVYHAVLLGIMLLPALSLAQSAADAVENDAVDIEVLTPDEEADRAGDHDALAAAIIKSCQFGASGDGCIFDVQATASGPLTVCTKARRSGNRWRATIAQVFTLGAVSRVGTGSTTTWTGCVSRNVVSGVNYEVLVIYERPLPGTFPTSVDVQFTGPVTVSGPRPRSGGQDKMESCGQTAEPISCGTVKACQIDLASDKDDFTFIAPEGAVASITIGDVNFRAGAPCWDLLFQGQILVSSVCDDQAEVGPLAAGQYTIRTYWLEAAFVSTGPYGLSLQGVSQSFHCGIPIAFGETKTDSIDLAGDTDTFNFDALLNEVVDIDIADIDFRAGFPCWALFNPDGSLIKSSCSRDQSGPLPKTGAYTIKVWWQPGAFVNTGRYALSLHKVP